MYYGFGNTSGGSVWYNRSVGIQGSVTDAAGGSSFSRAMFLSRAGSYTGPSDSRAVTSGTRSFSFTLDGSNYVGGITSVWANLCSDSGCFSDASQNMTRP